MCPTCGWPIDNCRCSSKSAADRPVPNRITAKLRLETKGRGGKAVTVVYDLPWNSTFLKDLTKELKQLCGTGGTTVEDTIELQGDQRDRLRGILLSKGFTVKG